MTLSRFAPVKLPFSRYSGPNIDVSMSRKGRPTCSRITCFEETGGIQWTLPERIRNQQVSGSRPLAGSNHINNLATAASVDDRLGGGQGPLAAPGALDTQTASTKHLGKYSGRFATATTGSLYDHKGRPIALFLDDPNTKGRHGHSVTTATAEQPVSGEHVSRLPDLSRGLSRRIRQYADRQGARPASLEDPLWRHEQRL